MDLNKTTILSLSLFALLIYFELAYLMGYDTGECPMFGTVIYNAPCRFFSLLVFFLGIVVVILSLAGRLKASFALSAFYFPSFPPRRLELGDEC